MNVVWAASVVSFDVLVAGFLIFVGLCFVTYVLDTGLSEIAAAL